MDRDELRDEIERSLARLGAETEGIAPDPRITDALVDAAREVRPAADPLARIANATRSLDAGDAFSEAVVARAREEAAPDGRARATGSWLDGVVRSGPAAVGLAALAAAASFLLFLATQGDVEEALASSVDLVEVSE
jgi:hypothetical protein